jgi:hypothetical protein
VTAQNNDAPLSLWSHLRVCVCVCVCVSVSVCACVCVSSAKSRTASSFAEDCGEAVETLGASNTERRGGGSPPCATTPNRARMLLWNV